MLKLPLVFLLSLFETYDTIILKIFLTTLINKCLGGKNMGFKIESIEIIGLYGVRDFLIHLNNNKLILVGENGSGKTTISRIIYAVLSCNWDLLRTYPFETIKIHFEDDTVEVQSKTLNGIFTTPNIERVEYLFDRRSGKKRFDSFISNILEIKQQYEKSNSPTETVFSHNLGFRVPYEYISEVIDTPNVKDLYKIHCKMTEKFQARILYLPTYRRIEEQLKTIFPDIGRGAWENGRKHLNNERAVELVEFGMDDVQRLVDDEREALKAFSQTQQNKLTLGYLSAIVSKNYEKSSSYQNVRTLTNEKIQEVLARIDSTIMPDETKEQVLAILNQVRTEGGRSNTYKRIVCHYFMQLVAFNEELTLAEQNIRDFQMKCNKYLVSNKINYNGNDFTCNLFNRVDDEFSDENKISFQNLSSGEKQIVSLFSHLYLDKDKAVFVFIDEPELSLSVDWQRTFLPDIVGSPNCCGLIATTHSPFTFDNELEENVHGINEFCTRG